jgi:hypothetical protein
MDAAFGTNHPVRPAGLDEEVATQASSELNSASNSSWLRGKVGLIEVTTEIKLKSTNFDRKFFEAIIVPNIIIPTIFIPAFINYY